MSISYQSDFLKFKIKMQIQYQSTLFWHRCIQICLFITWIEGVLISWLSFNWKLISLMHITVKYGCTPRLQFLVILYSCKTNTAQMWKRVIMGIKCPSHYRLWQKKPSKPPFCFPNIYLHTSIKHINLCENLQCAWKYFMVIKSQFI